MRPEPRAAFTLIELLVVIAIIAILAVVVVLTLNPSELLKQSRDANRVSDMATLNSALGLYQTDQPLGSLGNASSAYLSVPDPVLSGYATSTCGGLGMASPAGTYNYFCVSSANLRLASSSGWVPVNFGLLSGGAPFGVLPVDPINQTSSNFYYSYGTGSGQYLLSAFMESVKYAKSMATTGGADAGLYEMGSGISTLPDIGRGLIAFWPLDEGQGSTTAEYSGSGNTGTVNGAAVWAVPGKIGNALTFVNTSTYVGSATSVNMGTTWTVLGWVKTSSGVQMPMISNRGIGGSMYVGMTTGKIFLYGPCTPSSIAGVTTLNNGQFHQIGFTMTSSTVVGYLDGAQNLSVAVSSCSAQNGKIDIGWDPQNVNDYFNGTVDDVRIYDRALSAAEIQQIYNAEK